MSVDVSGELADRALTIAERMIAGAASVGRTFKEPPEAEPQTRRYDGDRRQDTTCYGCLYVDEEPLKLRIDERRKRIDHVMTESEKARKRRGDYVYPPRWDYISTGELRLTVNRAHSKYQSWTWKDGARRRLEDQVSDILLALLDEAIRIKADREERRLAEIEHRQQEELCRQQS